MKHPLFLAIQVALLMLLINACSPEQNRITSFSAITNFDCSDTLRLPMDLDDVVLDGIRIPTDNQISGGNFEFSFEFDKAAEATYFYKLYYQNESYKFPEEKDGKIHPLCHENFYGSWEDVNTEFKPLTETETHDQFQIVGNPRDEKSYYGGNLEDISYDEASIEKMKNNIRNSPEWYESIKQKAKNANMSTEKQLFLDVIWMINDQASTGDFNHRWKRNPRVGCYNFMLVVVTEEALKQLPKSVTNIGTVQDDGTFLNPFYYFLYGEGKDMAGVYTSISDDILKVNATLEPGKGVFINPARQRDEKVNTSYINALCNSDPELYKDAHFEQFMHDINRSYFLRNIPEAHDVIGENYSQEDFYGAQQRYDSSELYVGHTQNSICPCQTVGVDTTDHSIILTNPGNDDLENLRKENVGVKTRVGFVYGKYRGKIKFPELINEENVWNGLTDAFWMIYQGEGDWNKRRTAVGAGYIPKNVGGPGALDRKQKSLNYSEIDIEIVKTSPTWRKDVYLKDDDRDSDSVMFCCTNWDLANNDPKDFFHGRHDISYKDTDYTLHRWTETYKAITSKCPVNDNELFQGDYFYYEIEWKPTEIIWRVGSSPDNMRICGYMNDEVTSIPNNQMVCIITQEFHYAEWWPYQPFSQNWVPFPKNDIEGKVFEIVVE